MEIKHLNPAATSGVGTSKSASTGRAEKKSSENSSRTKSELNDAVSTQLSSRAKEMTTAKKIAKDSPDIRDEKKIEALKKRIENRQYQIDPGKVADGIAREALLDHFALENQEDDDV